MYVFENQTGRVLYGQTLNSHGVKKCVAQSGITTHDQQVLHAIFKLFYDEDDSSDESTMQEQQFLSQNSLF